MKKKNIIRNIRDERYIKKRDERWIEKRDK